MTTGCTYTTSCRRIERFIARGKGSFTALQDAEVVGEAAIPQMRFQSFPAAMTIVLAKWGFSGPLTACLRARLMYA